jgi:hypothetical protein
VFSDTVSSGNISTLLRKKITVVLSGEEEFVDELLGGYGVQVSF